LPRLEAFLFASNTSSSSSHRCGAVTGSLPGAFCPARALARATLMHLSSPIFFRVSRPRENGSNATLSLSLSHSPFVPLVLTSPNALCMCDVVVAFRMTSLQRGASTPLGDEVMGSLSRVYGERTTLTAAAAAAAAGSIRKQDFTALARTRISGICFALGNARKGRRRL